jgi:SAM-dependent methyltransferase
VGKKKSKLPEKGTRMPEIRQGKWDQLVAAYVDSIQAPSSESAKSHRFGILLNDLFGEQPGFIEEYVEGIEKYVRMKEKDRILRGRVDNLFGNLVIEFERDLRATRREAEDQVRKYVSFVWSDEASTQRRPYVGIATDGQHFAVYSPTLADESKVQLEPEDVDLRLVEEVCLSDLAPAEVYFWLDRYFRRQETLPPTTELIVSDFGVTSHAFHVAGQALLCLWGTLRERSEFAVVYESWEKYLLIVYGSSVADEELFIRHTYLATLAKLMAWCRLAEATTADADELVSVLEGEFFKAKGIENFLEEDFFSWVARDEARKTGIETARMLFSLLQNYNLRQLSEDVLKSLYQELVDPETRHDLGEYYTPDWLAHRMVRKLLDEKPEAKMLDPACGSGTFLYLAIREKRERLGDSPSTLKHIQEAVVGIDIHPLAVIVAKINYVLALGNLLQRRKKREGPVVIPVFLANTLRLPERFMKGPEYGITMDSRTVYIHERLLGDVAVYDRAIGLARDYAARGSGDPVSPQALLAFLEARGFPATRDDAVMRSVHAVAEGLRQCIESARDTIWAFILKNAYKPLFLRGRFDCIVGNPPWIAFHFLDPLYQVFVKQQVTQEYGLLRGRGELITHLEVATLFLVRAAELYLGDEGTIAFVLPRSVFSSDHHDRFRTGTFSRVHLALQEAWDLEGVKPLFNVPSCVVFAQKAGDARTTYPLQAQEVTGQLGRRNASLREAEQTLTVSSAPLFLTRVGSRSFWSTVEGIGAEEASHYAREFRQGATIVPRSFWFVEVKPSAVGFDPSRPPVRTAGRASEQAKAPYKGLLLEGNIEAQFLYATLLSTDLLPFGHLGYRLVLLPIEPTDAGYSIVRPHQARAQGCLDLATWLDKVKEEWQERRGDKAEKVSALGWLDYRRKLTDQNPRATYRVLYPTSATYMCATIVAEHSIVFELGQQQVRARGFVADYVTYWLQTPVREEAYYLVAVLNAPVVDRLLKPMQARGQWGPRHICKKVLELPIPEFDAARPEHFHVVQLGEACTLKVQGWLDSGGPGKVTSIGRLRTMVRDMLKEELKEVDELVEPMLRGD